MGSTQNRDLTKNLYSTSSAITKGTENTPAILKTTFTKQKDDGEDHDITVNFYQNRKDSVADAVYVDNANLNSSDTYYFLVKLQKLTDGSNKGKTVG